jgi:selenide,water dikinase
VETIGLILKGGETICAQAGIPIAGGHTIDSVEPIYGLVVLGLVHPSQVKRNAGARAGDKLVLGKPIGVGILSAALKKNALDADGYASLIDNTTKLNTPGKKLALLDGVHALTDVTGFGLLGHTLELARGAKLQARIAMSEVPLLPQVQQLAQNGNITGASGRNWQGYGAQVALADSLSAIDKAILTDPQTAGPLLVACAPEAVEQVLAIFRAEGFGDAVVIGEMQDGSTGVSVY